VNFEHSQKANVCYAAIFNDAHDLIESSDETETNNREDAGTGIRFGRKD